MRLLIAAFLLALSAGQALASKEMALSFSELVARHGDGEGSIVVRLRVNAAGQCEQLTVTFRGRTHSLPAALATEAPRFANGVRLSFEQGYPEIGGATVYVRLDRGFTSGTAAAITFAVSEDGAFRITQTGR